METESVGWGRLWFDGRIEEKDLDKSGGTLLSLEISGVTVISGRFLFLLSQLDRGFWTHAECDRRKKEKVLCVLGSTKSEILHFSKLINATFHQQMLSDSEASLVLPLGQNTETLQFF